MFRQDINELKNFRLKKGGMTFGSEGCAISCVFTLVEQEENFTFSVSKIKTKIKEMFKNEFIDDEFTIQGPEGWKGCAEVLGLEVDSVKYIDDPGYFPKDNEREILKLVKPGYAHFVYGDGFGHYSFDSLGHRPQQRDYRVKEKRVFVL